MADPITPTPPKAETAPTPPKAETRRFKALTALHLDGKRVEADAVVEIDALTHRQLAACGAVAGDWADGKAAKAKD